MARLRALRTTQLTQTDDRVKQTNEAVLGIRVVKLYTWEQSIEDRIAKLRAVELQVRNLVPIVNCLPPVELHPQMLAIVYFLWNYCLQNSGNCLPPVELTNNSNCLSRSVFGRRSG